MNLHTGSSLTCEVCVVGGGPAGSAVAIQLARLGYTVCLLERERFPRRHVGELLAPSVFPLLDALGLLCIVERAGFLHQRRAILRWSDDATREQSQSDNPGLLVERGRFDEILLTAAKTAGCRVIQPAIAHRASKAANGHWRIPFESYRKQFNLRARFIVDASGKRGYCIGQSTPVGPRTLCLFAWWRDSLEVARSNEHVRAAMRIEAGVDRWYWGAPLADGSYSAMVFIDPESLSMRGSDGLTRFYRRLLHESQLLSHCLKNRLIRPAKACDATCRQAKEVVGKDWIKAGESAFSLDPLSSQGIQAALRTALQAATVVHTILSRPTSREDAAQFYRQSCRDTMERHLTETSRLYAESFHSGNPFWQRRAIRTVSDEQIASDGSTSPPPRFDTRLRLSSEAKRVAVPLMQDNLIRKGPALAHPGLERPCAFVGGVAIEEFLEPLRNGVFMSALIRLWARRVPRRLALGLVHHWWNRGVIEELPT
ncbi:MAG: FAD-dependent oxidoreductase [Phycisphaerales bacterium]|nr:FAD-dependent oxidoreductase [Phycisphaerales bacterium]